MSSVCCGEAEPSLKDKILSFFKRASGDYADTPKLSAAAKKYYRTYKKLFDEFSARNAQNNAIEPLINKNGSYNNKNSVSDNVRTINDNNMSVSGREYVSYARKVLDTIRKAIQTKGKLDSDYNQVKISKVTPKMAKMVKSASGGSIDISKKYVALNGFDLWHEYKRHSDAANEVGRRQIPLTPEKMQEAIMAIYEPEIVESVFVTKNNPVQKQSFAYAKRSSDGHYVVVEAVGGKKNPNITPAMVLEFTPEKWKEMIDSDKTLGEILYETDEEMKSALDVEYNKKNRVTAAQFASSEAIANTPHSPRFNNSISQKSANSNPSGEKISEKSSGKDFALDIDGETLVHIRFGLKYSKMGKTTLYVLVDQNKISLEKLGKIKNDRGLQDVTADKSAVNSLPRSVTYSISQILSFVNSKDLLRYIPDDFQRFANFFI